MNQGVLLLLMTSFLALCTLLTAANAIPFYPATYSHNRHKDYLVEVEDPDAVLEMLAKLGQSILRAQHEGSNAKRGLDLGLGRGFSGSQAAKHLMGLAAANFAAGPGKKKRLGEGLLVEIPSRAELFGFDGQQPPMSNESEWSNNGGNSKD